MADDSTPVTEVCFHCGDPVVWHEGNGGQWLGAEPPRDWMYCHGSPEGPHHCPRPRRTLDPMADYDYLDDLVSDLSVTPNGRKGDTSSLAKPGYRGPRLLSDYERQIAHALLRKGHSKRESIRMARGLIKKAAKTGRWGDHGKAGAKTRAGAAASIAQRKTF